MALLGKSMSQAQGNLLLWHFPGRPIVVYLDRDAAAEAGLIQQRLQAARAGHKGDNRVVLADLPEGDGKDPADFTHEQVWYHAMKALGG